MLRPHAPSVSCLSCTNLLTTSPNLDRIEKFWTCGSSPSFIANPGYEPNQTPSFWSLILCTIKSPSFQKLLMTSLHDLRFSPPHNSKSRPRLWKMCNMHTRYRSLHRSIVGAPSRVGCLQHCKGAKQQNIRCIASSLKFVWYESLEWSMEESLVWNGRKLSVWNMEKLSSISYHALVRRTEGARSDCS